MGEDYEAMGNFKLFANGKPIATAFDANATKAFNACIEMLSEEEPQEQEHHYEWSATIDSKQMVKEIMQALGLKQDRIYSKRERKLFIRTVEHYGQVEFTLHDWQAKADGFEQGTICLVCPTPKSVKTFLRMKGLGKVTYKITKKC